MEYIINRGVAVIISNEFEGNKERSACGKDIGQMEELFQSLKFEVKTHKSLTATQMLQEIETESDKEYDCFALVISSHGKHERSSTSSTADCWRHYVLGNDNEKLFINEIIHRLNRSKTLAGKPKLIFLQTCRTKKYDNVDDKEAVAIANQQYDEGVRISIVAPKGGDDEDEDDDEDDKKSNDDNGMNDTKSDDSESDEEEDVDTSLDESDIAGESCMTAGDSGAMATDSGVTAGGSGATAGGSGAMAGYSGATAGNSGATAGGSGAVAGGSGATAGDSGATAGNSCAGAGMAGPAEIYDLFEIECPNDFLIMYPVMPGKFAISGPRYGSPMLFYLNELKSMLLEGRSLLEYLTAVCGEMAIHNYTMEQKTSLKPKQMFLHNLKAISKKEYRKKVMKIVGGDLRDISLEDADELVQERLKRHFKKRWTDPGRSGRLVKQMIKLIGIVKPFKTSACIMHRLNGKITFSGLK